MPVPIIIRSERIVPVDVDDTLVMHSPPSPEAPHVLVVDPLTSLTVRVWPNIPMVRLLKEEKARGATIVVWSRGGYAWAESVILALDLGEYVRLIMSKPLIYFDDTDVSKWLKDRIYLNPLTKYKQIEE